MTDRIPSHEAAAFHGLATNPAMHPSQRLSFALQSLDLYEAELERLRADRDKLAATIAAYLETDERGIHHAANTAHARAQRDAALAELAALRAAALQERTEEETP